MEPLFRPRYLHQEGIAVAFDKVQKHLEACDEIISEMAEEIAAANRRILHLTQLLDAFVMRGRKEVQ
jgi:hypothetical protein